MKARAGFVSNSSSSSFIFIGKSLLPRDIKNYDNVWLIGDYYGEGRDAFIIPDKIKDELIAAPYIDAQFFYAVKVLSESDSHTLSVEDKNKIMELNDIEIISIEKSYYDSYDNGDWREIYL